MLVYKISYKDNKTKNKRGDKIESVLEVERIKLFNDKREKE